jgi:hypothetical protein
MNRHSASFDVDVEREAALTSIRGGEGQDTITPLTNNVFLKQLSKLKHHESSKSINSINSTSSSSLNSRKLNAAVLASALTGGASSNKIGGDDRYEKNSTNSIFLSSYCIITIFIYFFLIKLYLLFF